MKSTKISAEKAVSSSEKPDEPDETEKNNFFKKPLTNCHS